MNKRIGALVLAVIMVLLLVAAPLSSIANAAEGTFSLVFHYDRPDGNYSNWDLFGWTSNGSAGYPFAADTDGEGVAATVELPSGTESPSMSI